MQKTITLRLIGFLGSLILTLAAYFIIVSSAFFHLNSTSAILVILSLAVLQSVVQFLFFLDMWREKGPRWNTIFFLSTVALIFIVVAFSIWIMNHLNYNMMP